MATSLTLVDTFVTFLALIGPQKVLLSFARVARTLDSRQLRLVAAGTALASAAIGAACALTVPWLATFFHISTASLELAAGVVFFIYAVGLVLGIHFDPAERPHVPLHADADAEAEVADPMHPFTSGFRAMLLPFVVSPLGVAAALQMSLSAGNWGDRWTVVLAFAVVALVDALCAIAFATLLGRAHEIILEMLSRLLGVLLTAVGVQLFLLGLADLGLLHSSTGH